MKPLKGFKPDYGLCLLQEKIAPTADLLFYDFHLFSLSVLERGSYSTTVDMQYQGELYALSLDFDHNQLEVMLDKAEPHLAAFVRSELSRDPESPRSIDLDKHLAFGVRARLGQLQNVEKEQFVPLVAQEIL